MSYRAFLSYSHAVDQRLAPALQSALHRFAKPWYRMRALRVFRDTTSLAANPALWPAIERALADSEYFLLLASPESAGSAWVEREVEWWLSHRPADRLLIVLTGGTLVWDDGTCDWDWAATTAMSPRLRGRFGEEPLYVDLRWARNADDLSLRHARFRAAVLDLAAALHGRPKDELDGEDVRLHRRARRLAWAVTCLLAVLTVAAGGAAWVAHRQAQIAEGRRREAERERGIALGRQLAAEAEVARTQHAALLPRSVLLAIEAARRLEVLGLRSAEADQTLRRGLALLPPRRDVLPHQDVVAAAIDAGGARLATAGHDGSVRLWDLPARRELGRVSLGGELLTAVFSPELAWLATVVEGDRTSVRVHDVASGEIRRRIDGDRWVTALAFSPDARLLASGGLDHTVRVTALADGREVLRAAHRSVVNRIVWSADGSLLATATGSPADRLVGRPPQDDAAHVWEVATGRQLARLPHDRAVEAVALSPDGSLVVTGSLDHTARVWETRTGREVARMVHEENVAQVAFAPDGRHVASGSGPYLAGFQQQTVRLWDTRGRELGRAVHEGGVRDLVFSPDGRYLLSGGSDRTARLLDASGREVARAVLDGDARVVGFSPDGRTALAAGGGEIRMWPVGSRFGPIVRTERHPVYVMAFSPDGRRLATVGSGTAASLWDLERGPRDPRALTHDGFVVDVAFAPRGGLLATAGHDRTARLWDVESGAERARLEHDGEVLRVAFTRTGERLATASSDGTARVWDAATGRESVRFEHGERVTAVSVAPDGRALATGTEHGTVRIWDLASRRELARFELATEVRQLGYGPGGRHLVAAGYVRTAMVYDTATGGEPVRLEHDREVNAFAYSPDGTVLATADTDGAVHLWSPGGDRELGRLRHEAAVDALAFSPDGRHLATGSSDRSARVWTLDGVREILRLPHPTVVNAVAFSTDGRRLATASGDPLVPEHAVRLWRWRPADLIAEACRRLDRNLTLEEWQHHVGDERYRKTCAHVAAHPSALAADLERARAAAAHRDGTRVARRYRRLAREAAASRDLVLANAVCWYGSLDGFARDVLAACERAVALAGDDPSVRDSRGLARALTGDRAGALEDFAAFVDWARDDAARAPFTARREGWVSALRAGRDPFDAETLRTLRAAEGGEPGEVR
jgi:WD40 repeat protein